MNAKHLNDVSDVQVDQLYHFTLDVLPAGSGAKTILHEFMNSLDAAKEPNERKLQKLSTFMHDWVGYGKLPS